MAVLNFNAQNVAPDPGRGDPIPAGWYDVAMEKSEMKPTSQGDGAYLECVFGVLSGQFQGRKLFSRFNLRNNNPQAQEIAYKQFSAVCHAIGHLQIGDSSELHGRPLKVKVKIKPAEGQYEANNEISAYKNINEQVQQPAAPLMPGAPPAMPMSAAVPPVMNGAWAAAPQQQWAPPPQLQPPPHQPAPPIPQQWAGQQPQAPAGPPAWQPPPGQVQQPWAQQPPPQAAQPQQAPPMPPANQPQPWSPPPAGVAQPTAAIPPWAQPKQ